MNDSKSHNDGGQVTGTADKDYNIIWFTEQSLSNALRLETYIADAEQGGDRDLAEFFRRVRNSCEALRPRSAAACVTKLLAARAAWPRLA